MRLLNCIITYNRPYYLKNTVESLFEYFRFGDTLVIDDGSDHPIQLSYLSELEGTKTVVIRRPRSNPEAYLGGLYSAMNQGLEYAKERGYDYIQFIQDDMQFMWHDPEILEKVSDIFSQHDEAIQVMNLFQKKIVMAHYLANNTFEYKPASRSYRVDRGAGDLGFFKLERVEELNFSFSDSETKSGQKWYRKGYRVYLLQHPTLTFLPWPEVFHGGRKARTLLPTIKTPPRNKYYFKPFTKSQIEKLKAQAPGVPPSFDDFGAPWGWKCLYPYWYTEVSSPMTFFDGYLRFLFYCWRKGDFVIPRIVSAE